MGGRSRIKLVASPPTGNPKFAADDAPGVDRAKKSFLTAMSHELRTPLNAINGFAEIIDAEIHGPMAVPQYRDYIRDILASSRHLLRIVEDVLEISSGEAGSLVLAKREVDMAELVGSALRPFEQQCRARGLRTVVDVPDDIVAKVDPERLTRAIASLISNAVKFTGDGGVIRITGRMSNDDRLIVSVSDNGIGMNPAMVERAFAPFVQLADQLARPYDGAGLGLPLARLLVELHGGSVRLDSRLRAGTTATIDMPAY